MRASFRALLAVAAVTALFAVAGCGGERNDAVRIGVLVDCTGAFGALRDLELAAAELPLLERRAQLAGPKPGDGVIGARVAGRPVDLVLGCAEWSTYTVLIAEARRLIEKEGVNVLIGPSGESDGLVLRDLARRHPGVVFLLAESRSPETTLHDPVANLFRFQPDGAQLAAGLGSYAYHDLGWRTAAIVADDFVLGWSTVAGFVAEFCALGGRIVSRIWTPAAAPLPEALAARIPPEVDGVALMPGTGAILDWSGFVRAYARLHPDVAQRLVLGPEALVLETNRVHAARLAVGVVAGDQGEFNQRNLVWRRMQRDLAKLMPGVLPPRSSPAEYPLVVAYRNAMEATLVALESVDGDPTELMAALAKVQLDGPTGRIRLDANRQAIAPVYLSRVEVDAGGKPVVRTFRVVSNVEQTFGGYFSATTPAPTRATPACKKGTPPPWARGS